MNREAAPACRDEIVVYEFRSSPEDAGTVVLKADKIVDGEPVSMGVLTLTYSAEESAWVAEVHGPNASGVWSFRARGRDLTGTLVSLPGRALVRRVKAGRP